MYVFTLPQNVDLERLKNKKRITRIRNKTKTYDVSTQISRLKWKFAVHNLRQKYNGSETITNKRKDTSEIDDLKKHAAKEWIQIAHKRGR